MPKRRSIGVALAGWYFILNAIIVFSSYMGSLTGAWRQEDALPKAVARLVLFVSVLVFLMGNRVLKLNEWGRRFALAYCVLAVACCLAAPWLFEARSAPELVLFSLVDIFHGSLFFFLTRPRVREQFRPVNKTH